MNKANEFTLNVNVRVDFSPLVIDHQSGRDADTKAILRSIERLGRKIMDFTQALDLLTTNINDLDASIQQEIAEFEELKRQQGGTLNPEQQEKFDGLVARIVALKEGLDTHS